MIKLEIYGIIYKVTNLVNNKIYIGQTTNSLNIRKTQHISDARNNSDMLLHKAIRKYGEDAFKWEVIDKAYSKEELNNKEKYWIVYYKSNQKEYGYNCTNGGDAFGGKGEDNYWYGKRRTEENKKRISETLKKTRCEKGNPRAKSVIQLKLNGEFVAEFESAVQAGKSINRDSDLINACCRQKRHTAYGYLWLYKENYTEEFVKALVDKCNNRKSRVEKAVVQLDLNGNFIKEYKSIKEASLETGCNISNITQCCKGKRYKTSKGYKWMYKEDYLKLLNKNNE